MPDFWPACGYRLLTTGADGRLAVTDDFLRSFLVRPELTPIPESCPAEQRLHDALLADPRGAVTATDLSALVDVDARENYAIWLRFRARLTDSASLEAAYAALFRGDGVDVPPLFVQQMTQVLLRHILTADADPMQARAAPVGLVPFLGGVVIMSAQGVKATQPFGTGADALLSAEDRDGSWHLAMSDFPRFAGEPDRACTHGGANVTRTTAPLR